MTDKPTTAQKLEELFGKVDLEQVIWDIIVTEMKEAHNKQLFDDINPDIILHMKNNRPMNLFEKLDAGWYWFRECFWVWVMCITNPEDTGGDFFCHICSDYVKYEEDTYYE
jgi:hypothetical protein